MTIEPNTQEEATMTQLLERAYSKVSQLPDKEQDAIAKIILEAMENGTSRTSETTRSEEAFEGRRARLLAVIAACDELAGPDGDRDSVEDLRIIRDKRMADIG